MSAARCTTIDSVMELLTANYSFLNERLATHYGIRDVYGNHFRRVTFTDGTRGGLLGQASILTVTSYPNRTSVTMRGRWLLANLLGAPPPPPPPDVPALKEAGVDGAASIAARADGGAPQESGVRVVSSADGPARILAREFRRPRQVAHGRATARRSMRRRRFPTARGSTASPVCARCSSATRKISCARSPGSCWRTRSAAASTITTCRPSARSCAMRRRPITPGRRSSPASSRAHRSAWPIASGSGAAGRLSEIREKAAR